MKDETEKKINLCSYKKVWRVEKKIYSIDKLPLPVPVNPLSVLYTLLISIFIFLIGKIIPFINYVPFIIRLAVIPYFLSNYMMKKKLDGKNPIRYFLGYIKFQFIDKKKYMEYFNEYTSNSETETIKLYWNCSIGKIK